MGEFAIRDGEDPELGRTLLLVAEEDGRELGTLRVQWLWGYVPLVAFVVVAEHARRGGVGRALLAEATLRLRGEGCERLHSSYQANNAPAKAWHEALGFARCGALVGFNRDGSDEVFVRLDL